MRALVGNAADESQVKGAKKQQLAERQRELLDLQTLLAQPAGRRVIWKWLTACGLYRSSFSRHPEEMAYLEGQRQIGLRLLDDVTQAEPAALLAMMKEHQTKENENGGSSRSKDRDDSDRSDGENDD